MGEMIKVTVPLPEEDVETVKRLATERGVSPNHVIRCAIASEAFISQILSEGGKILIEKHEGAVDEEGKPTTTIREVLFTGKGQDGLLPIDPTDSAV